jgi:hypothetical protein
MRITSSQSFAESVTSHPKQWVAGFVSSPVARYILVASLLLNILIVFALIPSLSHKISSDYNQGRFTDGYDLIAANLADGHGYRFYPDTAPTMMREPGYPVLLAGIYVVFGQSFFVVKCANLLFAILTSLLIRSLTSLLVRPPRSMEVFSGDLAASLFLIHPGILIAESRGGVEVLFSLLLTLFILLLVKAYGSGSALQFATAGIILGVIVLVRSTPLLVPLFLLPFWPRLQQRGRSTAQVLLQFSALVLPMLLVLLPWTIRNYRLTHHVVPTASVLGVSAQAGQYINAELWSGRPVWLLDREASRIRDHVAEQLGYQFEDGANGYYQTFYDPQDELRFSRYLFQEVKARYRLDPLLFLRCILQNAFNFWFGGRTWFATVANVFVQLPYLIFAWIGLWSLKRRGYLLNTLPLLVLIGAVYLVHLPILAQARYSIPFIPLIAILGVAGLTGRRWAVAAASSSIPS